MDFGKSFRLYRFMVLLCVLLQTSTSVVQADELSDEIDALEDFSAAYTLIKRQYVSPVSPTELINAAISGMLQSLDPYSDLLTREDMETLELHSVGQYVGIGVTVQKSEDLFVVTQVFRESPAEKAGLQPGDIITRIGDTELRNKSGEGINKLMVGDLDSMLELEFYRSTDSNQRYTRKIRRATIKTNSVDCSTNSTNTIVITIHQFAKHTAKEISTCKQGKNYNSIILDLRNNPGGLLISSVEVAELFLDVGEIVKIKNREGITLETYISRRRTTEPKPSLYVLINHFTASAAEILAGAIKDRQAGILIGETSYGKGVVQSVYPLGEELFVKLTTARYFTPSGKLIDQNGITPHIEIKDSLDLERYGDEDRIFQKSLELIERKAIEIVEH